MDPGKARTITLHCRVRPGAVAKIDDLRGKRSRSDVLREAINDWLRKDHR